MVELIEIEQKKSELERQMRQLEKEKQKIMVGNDAGFLCKNCKTFVIITNAYHVKYHLCCGCMRKKRDEEGKKVLMKKLLEAKIVDIEIEGYSEIKSITAHRNGMMYKLKACGDGDVGYIDLHNEWKQEYRESESILRPGDKPRVERPLLLRMKQ